MTSDTGAGLVVEIPSHPGDSTPMHVLQNEDEHFLILEGAARIAPGRMFAVEHFDVEPDIICMAKGIASGFPFAALGTTEELSARWPTGSHGGTYGGNAIGCAAALATIEVVTAPGFMENVNERGEQLQRGLREIQAEDAGITQVRGLGLMIGTDFNDPARVAAVQSRCLSEGHLIVMNAGTYGRTLRWMPPLIVNEREIDLALAAFGGAVKATS